MKSMPRLFVAMTTALLAIALWAVSAYPTQEPVPPQAPAAPPRGGNPGSESGWSTFQTRCAICHSNAGPNQGPSSEAIRQMTPEKIYEALTTGKMKAQAEGLADPQVRRIAEFMSGRPLGSSKVGSAENMMNKCRNNPPLS